MRIMKILPFYLGALLCFTPWVTSPIALVIGFFLASSDLVPQHYPLSQITKKLLAVSIVALGFGIAFKQALLVTSDGLGLITATIVGTLLLGSLLAKLIKLEPETGYLISAGTSICGGSAIAAVAPAIRANEAQTGIALATVFVLNAIALFLFPVIGHALGLSQQTFGTWAAIAIHDTSSVVGAASAYGEQALKVATTLKLARALWIIPVAIFSALLFRRERGKLNIPYFIFFYCAAIALSDWLPAYQALYTQIFAVGKQGLVLSLFLIGCGISPQKIKAAGAKPLILGGVLWAAVSVSSLSWLLLVG